MSCFLKIGIAHRYLEIQTSGYPRVIHTIYPASTTLHQHHSSCRQVPSPLPCFIVACITYFDTRLQKAEKKLLKSYNCLAVSWQDVRVCKSKWIYTLVRSTTLHLSQEICQQMYELLWALPSLLQACTGKLWKNTKTYLLNPCKNALIWEPKGNNALPPSQISLVGLTVAQFVQALGSPLLPQVVPPGIHFTSSSPTSPCVRNTHQSIPAMHLHPHHNPSMPPHRDIHN